MNIMCKKTCNLCETEDGPTMPPASCEDTHPGCYLSPEFCQVDWMKDTNHYYSKAVKDFDAAQENMEKLCPKTCNLCE